MCGHRITLLEAMASEICAMFVTANGASCGYTHKALKGLKCCLFQVKVVSELKLPDGGKQCHYCEWFLDFICDNVSVRDKTCFTVETWFHLHGYIKSQNAHSWATENPHVL